MSRLTSLRGPSCTLLLSLHVVADERSSALAAARPLTLSLGVLPTTHLRRFARRCESRVRARRSSAARGR